MVHSCRQVCDFCYLFRKQELVSFTSVCLRAGERRGDAVTLIVERRIGGRALVVALAGAGEWAAKATKAFVAADLERENRKEVTIERGLID